VANGSGLPRGKQELGLIGGQQIGQRVWDSFGIGLVAPVLDPAFLPQNLPYVNLEADRNAIPNGPTRGFFASFHNERLRSTTC
jgi:hypothetical protein